MTGFTRLGETSTQTAFMILETLKKLGYETGSGVMVGIPGQTYKELAQDILIFRELDLDMVGVGPYLPHPETPLGQDFEELCAPAGEQVPNSELMTYKVVALTRLVCPGSQYSQHHRSGL